ncbi:MAG: hypothetical protein RDV48_23775 [Candidatus Eremiobacteraeota bacterium]|nr:hypothetical protein [Candidatus Eremiobacteraeota bacterium]
MASFQALPLSSLLADSDLVVSGTLKGLKAVSMEGDAPVRRYEGDLHIDGVLAGDAAPGSTCRLRWDYVVGLSSSLDPSFLAGQKGIWLLQAVPSEKGGSLFTVSHPSRFLGQDRKKEVESLLAQPLFTLEVEEGDHRPGTPFYATFVVSTWKEKLEIADYIEESGGKLVLHGSAVLHIECGVTKAAPGRNVVRGKGRPAVISRKKPLRVKVDLARYYTFRGEGASTLWWGTSEKLSSPRYTFYQMK